MDNLIKILEHFQGKKILIIGDVMLDKYVYGDVSRISPEAPVPVVKITEEFFELGGAGNVASNVASLGGDVCIFSFIGKDEQAKILKDILEKKKIEYYFQDNSVTPLKIRISGKNQQLLRMDVEEVCEKKFDNKMKELLLEKAENSDIIIISDYAKGVVNQDLMDFLSDYKKKIIVDPKYKNAHFYKEVFLIKCNEKEAKEIANSNDVFDSVDIIRNELISNVIVTRGEKGMIIFSDKKIEIPTYAKEVYDVSGAGDTVIATLGLAIASGASLEEAAILANHAAGIAVEKKGTYSVGLNELENRLYFEESKILDLQKLKKIVEDLKRKGKRIIWTNGCFDILHIGHKRYLEEAKKLGGILIVGIDSDESVRKLKGPERPINNQEERAEILASMDFVDYVTIFGFGGVRTYLEELKPDFYVKGGDYNIDTINQEERKIVEGYGGKIVLVVGVKDKSTTNTLKKIKSNGNSEK